MSEAVHSNRLGPRTVTRLNQSEHQSAVALLRAATRELHEELHRHPLVRELLSRPTLKCYQAVLEAFLSFYAPTEVLLVESARRLGVVDQYPRAMRTDWLISDLKSLGCNDDRLARLSNRRAFPPLDGIGEFAGCLYVVQGSALGGRVILQRVACELSIEQSCRFLTSGGTNTARIWKHFVRFCDSQCCGPEARREAVQSAQRAFEFVADCLAYAVSQRTTNGESQGDRASANNRSHSESRTPPRMSHSANGVRSTNSSATRSI